ncbi:MAG TPA: SMC-Scp complex subunit ScpB, partial [bacterium]|nr:SMC-Scp complex subunit ScpB [bacterium]
MESIRLKSFLESLIFVSEHPLKIPEMLVAVQNYEELLAKGGAEAPGDEEGEEPVARGFSSAASDPASQLEAVAEREAEKIGRSEIIQALEDLAAEYRTQDQRGIVLAEVANGWQFRTKPENAAILQQFSQPKPTKISKPSLETLAIVAYKQPITRVEIDLIRGVDSGGVLKTLLEKNLVRIVGKKDEPGKPMLYGTTQDFLELFQLKSLQELPTLK